MRVNVSGPMSTPATLTVDVAGWFSRLTSLYGAEMRTTSMTPGNVWRFSDWNCSMSPTRPTIVRCTPRLTNAEPPAARTVSTTASSCSPVASDAMTMTTPPSCHAGLCLQPLDCGVASLPRAELDQQHGREHEYRADDRPRAAAV